MAPPLGPRTNNHREPDNPRGIERRAHNPRRGGMRFPAFQEQGVQFCTRYLFLILGIAFFNLSPALSNQPATLHVMNTAFAAYFIFNSAALFHAWRQPIHPLRYRLAMWVDIILIAACVVNDPYDIPPSLLVFIMVVLGNGMRYGMRMFGEALLGSFAAAAVALGLRYASGAHGVTYGMVFLSLFAGIILIYAYTLMSRIESAHHLLERSSRQDALTGLMNRRGLVETAAALFERIENFGGIATVMLADLDHFKTVNDNHGHARGDEVLRRFADILHENIRATDIAARYGGDEFLVLMPDTSASEGEQVAQRIQESFARWSDENGYLCGATIGIGEAPCDGRTLATVLDKVDAALYHAKASSSRGGLRQVDRQQGYHEEAV